MLTTKCYKNLIIFPKGLSPQGQGREWGLGRGKGQLPLLWEGPVGWFCSGKAPWGGVLGVPGFLCLAGTLGKALAGLSFLCVGM